MTIQSPVSPRLVAGLCLSVALSVSGVLYLSQPSQAASGPISVPVASSQMSFAPLVSEVKPAVVQITSLSGGQAVRQDIPELEGPFGDMLRRYYE